MWYFFAGPGLGGLVGFVWAILIFAAGKNEVEDLIDREEGELKYIDKQH